MTVGILDPADLPARRRLTDQGEPVGLPLDGWRPPPAPRAVALEGRYARVEPLTPDHAPELFDAFEADPSGRPWTYMAHGPFADRASFQAWVAQVSGRDDPLFFRLAAAAGDRPLGVAALLRSVPAHGVTELGSITLCPAARRTREATEGLFLLMAHVFETLGYRRLEWKCDALNAASRRAARRLGFRFEGVFLNATVYKGRNRDTAWYAITDAEWPPRAAAIRDWLDPSNFDVDGRQRRALSALMDAATEGRQA